MSAAPDLRAEIVRLHEIIHEAELEARKRQALIDKALVDTEARHQLIDKITSTLLRAELLLRSLKGLP